MVLEFAQVAEEMMSSLSKDRPGVREDSYNWPHDSLSDRKYSGRRNWNTATHNIHCSDRLQSWNILHHVGTFDVEGRPECCLLMQGNIVIHMKY